MTFSEALSAVVAGHIRNPAPQVIIFVVFTCMFLSFGKKGESRVKDFLGAALKALFLCVVIMFVAAWILSNAAPPHLN